MTTEELTITEAIIEDDALGPLAQAFFDLELLGTNIEHREQMAKTYWESLTDEDLRIVADTEEGMLVATVAMKSIFESDNPLSFQAIYSNEDELEKQVNQTSLVAGLELLNRQGLIESDGTYFYNPFVDTYNTGFFVADTVAVETTEDRLDALYK